MTSVKSIHKDEEYAFPTRIRPGLSQAYIFTREVVRLWPESRFPEEGYFLGKEEPDHNAAPPDTPGSMAGTPGIPGTPGSMAGTPGGIWSGSGGGVGTGMGNRNGNGVGTPMPRRPTVGVVGGGGIGGVGTMVVVNDREGRS